MQQSIVLIVMIVLLIGMMWWSSKRNKDAQQKRDDFRANLKPGAEVITIGRTIGKIVEVDEQYDEVVIDTEGTKMRFALNAISQEYVRPAYVSDDEVDEEGNPLPAQIEGDEQEPTEAADQNASGDTDANEVDANGTDASDADANDAK